MSGYISEVRAGANGLFIQATNKTSFTMSQTEIKALYSGKTQEQGDAALQLAIQSALGAQVYDLSDNYASADPATGKITDSISGSSAPITTKKVAK